MTEERDTYYIIEDYPPPLRPRWYCAAHPSGFDDVDEAVAWALERAPSVIVRTLGGISYRAGSHARIPDEWPWPPSDVQRSQIDHVFAFRWNSVRGQEAAWERHVEARDAWLLEARPGQSYAPPSHRTDIGESEGVYSIVLEEFSPELCAAWNSETHVSGFGSSVEAIARAAGLDPGDGWVGAVEAALARDRKWPNRSHDLAVRLGAGEMFHLSFSRNRESIRTYGLDWTLATGSGIAGGRAPELEGIFLDESIDGADFFAGMTQEPVDIWAARVDGLWLESGPDGWWIVTEPLPPSRVRLVAVSEGLPRPFVNGKLFGLSRNYRYLDGKDAP